jgi:prepilin-type N-terminal cleavage/methylation domain-containing protein
MILKKAPRHHGFTLIELLIVVAIIAILAAIAVPNFLEAQTRAKVSRVKADLRSIATALEAYRVDNNLYPPTPFVATSFDGGVLRVIPNLLSTPVAYITTANFQDPFIVANLPDFHGITRAGDIAVYQADPAYPLDPGGDPLAGRRYYYQSNNDPRRSPGSQAALRDAWPVEGQWVLASLGPNRERDLVQHPTVASLDVLEPYDATNGTISAGDISRSQRETEGSLTP